MHLSRLWELATLEVCLKQLPGNAKMLHVPPFRRLKLGYKNVPR